MKISTKFHVHGLAMFASTVIIGMALAGISRQTESIRSERAQALAILEQVRELKNLGFEYVLHREARVLDQWHRLNGTIEGKLDKIQAGDSEERQIIQIIKHDQSAANALLGKLTDQGQKSAFRPTRYGEMVLVDQFLLKTQDLVSHSVKLENSFDDRVSKADEVVKMWIAAFLVTLALTTLLINWYFAHRIKEPLTRLTMGANNLAEGRLDHHIGLQRSDELGELSNAFDKMADLILKSHADLEQRVQQRTAELSAANKELEAFAYTVSHDLRAPLRAMKGFAHMMIDNYANRLDEDGIRQLEVIHDNAQKMSRLIDDLLAFSLTGQRELKLEDTDMMALATSIANELRFQEPDRAIMIDISPLPRIPCDPAMIRQVWVNLLSNAIKFTRPREQTHIEIRGLSEAGENIYSVKDNGVGFDMHNSTRLFGVFQRLHGNDKFEGIGVGLAIVKRIIERHKGRVWAESGVNQGATFYFALPK